MATEARPIRLEIVERSPSAFRDENLVISSLPSDHTLGTDPDPPSQARDETSRPSKFFIATARGARRSATRQLLATDLGRLRGAP